MKLDVFMFFVRSSEAYLIISVLYVALFAITPWALGFLASMLLLPYAKPPTWLSGIGAVLTLIGWGGAFYLGQRRLLAYETSIQLGSLLFVPGLFLWSFSSAKASSK